MKRDNTWFPVLNIIGFVGAHLFAALVILPLIVFFVLTACFEFLATGTWQGANEQSQAMGRRFERPIWYIRSIGGTLPFEPPKS